MNNHARRPRRILAGMLAGALALSVTPILGLTGVASAADALPPLADPIGAGNFCENAPSTNPFSDVSASDPSLDEIICLVGTGLTTGTTATTYSPNGNVTRRQMALFIKRLADLARELEIDADTVAALPAYDGTPDFSDHAPENADFEEAIGQLSQAGIVGGFPDGTFKPGALVSRRQMAAFVNNLNEFLTGEALPDSGDFFDDDNGDSGEANLDALAGVGVFQGDGAGNVFPGNNLTRRQMANILLRYAQVLFADGVIEGAFDAETPVGTIAVDPPISTTPIVKQVSDADNTNRGLQNYTATVPAGITAVDVALIDVSGLALGASGITFPDTNADDRADRLNTAVNAGFETLNGNSIPITAYINNAPVVNGTVTVGLDATAVGALAPVFFVDANNNNDLDLDANNVPSEAFGLGQAIIWVGADAPPGNYTGETVIIGSSTTGFDIVSTRKPFPVGTDRSFAYDDNDLYEYATSGGGGFSSITKAQFESYLSNVDATVGAFDQLNVIYVPGGTSTFQLALDAPEKVGALTAALRDGNGDGNTDAIRVTWTPPVNPNVVGYQVERRAISGGIPGPWAVITCNTQAGPNFISPCDDSAGLTANGLYQYRVRAVANATHFGILGLPQLSNEITFPSSGAVTSTRPVSTNTAHVQGANPGNTPALDAGDNITVQFDRTITVAAGATVTIQDLPDDDRFVLTHGTGSTFTVVGGSTLNIAVTTTPTASLLPAGSDGIADGTNMAVIASSGITGDGGAWNLPASHTTPVFTAAPATRQGVIGGANTVLVGQPTATANAANDTITVTGGGSLTAGDTISVYNASGVSLVTAAYTGGAQNLVSAQNFNNGDVLYVQYLNNDGGGNGEPSEALEITVAAAAVPVQVVANSATPQARPAAGPAGGTDTVIVTFNQPINSCSIAGVSANNGLGAATACVVAGSTVIWTFTAEAAADAPTIVTLSEDSAIGSGGAALGVLVSAVNVTPTNFRTPFVAFDSCVVPDVNCTITFSKPVTGLTIADFSTVGAMEIVSVTDSGDGMTWNLVFDQPSAAGDVTLNADTVNATGIAHVGPAVAYLVV